MIYLMLPGGSRVTCMIWNMFPGLNLYHTDYADAAQNLGKSDLQ